jgi:molybdopterin converting factor small subunit
MKIEVRFFALYRERAGCSRTSMDLPAGATVADLTAEVRRRHPGLAPPDVSIVVAVNTDYAEPDTVLNEREHRLRGTRHGAQ